MASPSSDLLLLLLVTSSGTEPYPLLLLPRRRSPFSIDAAQRLGPAVESQDLGTRLLPVEAVKRANYRSTRLSHGLNRSGGVPGSNGSASFDGGASGGGTARDSVGEVGGVVVVRSANDPWGQPRGPMEILTIRHIAGTPTRPVTTVMRQTPSSYSSPSTSL
jgi:hypothetical protein